MRGGLKEFVDSPITKVEGIPSQFIGHQLRDLVALFQTSLAGTEKGVWGKPSDSINVSHSVRDTVGTAGSRYCG